MGLLDRLRQLKRDIDNAPPTTRNGLPAYWVRGESSDRDWYTFSKDHYFDVYKLIWVKEISENYYVRSCDFDAYMDYEDDELEASGSDPDDLIDADDWKLFYDEDDPEWINKARRYLDSLGYVP